VIASVSYSRNDAIVAASGAAPLPHTVVPRESISPFAAADAPVVVIDEDDEEVEVVMREQIVVHEEQQQMDKEHNEATDMVSIGQGRGQIAEDGEVVMTIAENQDVEVAEAVEGREGVQTLADDAEPMEEVVVMAMDEDKEDEDKEKALLNNRLEPSEVDAEISAVTAIATTITTTSSTASTMETTTTTMTGTTEQEVEALAMH